MPTRPPRSRGLTDVDEVSDSDSDLDTVKGSGTGGNTAIHDNNLGNDKFR